MTARIYLRISRPDEAKILLNQRAAAANHVVALGLGPAEIKVYDETASGGDEDRPGLGKLLNELRRGDIVIFQSLSRMTRGGIGAALDILRQIERRGAGWHFIDQPVLDWDAGTPKLVRDIILAVFAAIDEDYRLRIGNATRAALARRRALGVKLGGRKKGQTNLKTRIGRSPP